MRELKALCDNVAVEPRGSLFFISISPSSGSSYKSRQPKAGPAPFASFEDLSDCLGKERSIPDFQLRRFIPNFQNETAEVSPSLYKTPPILRKTLLKFEMVLTAPCRRLITRRDRAPSRLVCVFPLFDWQKSLGLFFVGYHLMMMGLGQFEKANWKIAWHLFQLK